MSLSITFEMGVTCRVNRQRAGLGSVFRGSWILHFGDVIVCLGSGFRGEAAIDGCPGRRIFVSRGAATGPQGICVLRKMGNSRR
jgi:hypothetical protein